MMRPKILIVDDDPRMLYVLEQALSNSNYDVLKATSGIRALSKLKSEPFALVLLDIKMSVMDGLTTARMIRNETMNRDVPIILISGMNEKDLVSTGYTMGAIDFILKPVDYHALRSKVQFFTDLYSRTEALRIAEEQLRRVRSELERALARQNELLQALEIRKTVFFGLKENVPATVWISGTDAPSTQDSGDIHPDDFQQCVDQIRTAYQNRNSFQLEYRIRNKDGSYRRILDCGLPRFSPDGDFMGFIGSTVDITNVPAEMIHSNTK